MSALGLSRARAMIVVVAPASIWPKFSFASHSAIGAVSPFGGNLSAENDVRRVLGGLMFCDAIAERWQIDPSEHRFALPEHDRGQSEMQLVDQTSAKILTHRLNAAANLHITALGGEP